MTMSSALVIVRFRFFSVCSRCAHVNILFVATTAVNMASLVAKAVVLADG